MEVRKGFVFSIDTAFAIIIAIIIVLGIFFNLSKSQDGAFGNLYLSKIANDALITLNKNKTLETLDATTIKNSLNDIIPDNLAFKLNITVYECNEPKCDNFKFIDSIFIIEPNVSEKDSIIAKRPFITFLNNRIQNYSIAELRVWLI